MQGLARTLVRIGLAALALTAPLRALADADRAWYERASDELVQSYDEGQTYLYLPFRSYHMRSVYTQAQIDNYQEHPPGIGIGRGRIDEKENWHGVYAMGFQDSHFLPQWMVGYNRMYGWHLCDDARINIGYAAFITTRADYAHYAPVPGIVPIAGLEVHRFSVEATYVPGGKSFGNILFFWAKFRLESRNP
jgi:hypothetical protein